MTCSDDFYFESQILDTDFSTPSCPSINQRNSDADVEPLYKLNPKERILAGFYEAELQIFER